jgi:hypothetical protein
MRRVPRPVNVRHSSPHLSGRGLITALPSGGHCGDHRAICSRCRVLSLVPLHSDFDSLNGDESFNGHRIHPLGTNRQNHCAELLGQFVPISAEQPMPWCSCRIRTASSSPSTPQLAVREPRMMSAGVLSLCPRRGAAVAA